MFPFMATTVPKAGIKRKWRRVEWDYKEPVIARYQSGSVRQLGWGRGKGGKGHIFSESISPSIVKYLCTRQLPSWSTLGAE